MNPLNRFALLGLLVALPLINGCQNADATNNTMQSPESPATPVETYTVDTADLAARFTTTGTLESVQEADVVARVSGVIEHISVDEGDYVEAGEILATLDYERFEQARLQVAAELRGVEQELRRLQQMAEQQMASADAVERLLSNRDRLQARLRLAEIDVESASIRAPISGYIAQRYAKVGNLIQQHERKSLFHIVDLEQLEATLHVPERDLAHIATGQPVELEFFDGATTAQAVVARISPAIDRSAGTFRVTVRVANPSGELRSGMFTRAHITYAQHPGALRIPHYALMPLDSRHYVYRVVDGIASRQEVKTGLRDGQWVEITEGLSEGDAIVVTGQNNLNDSTRVASVNP